MPHSSDSDIRGISAVINFNIKVADFLYAYKKQDWGLTWRSINLTIQDTNKFFHENFFPCSGKKKKKDKAKY